MPGGREERSKGGLAHGRTRARARREADAFERLLAGLDRGEIVIPDEGAREAVEAMATAADQENNYAKVVAEHEALFGLLARLSPTGAPR